MISKIQEAIEKGKLQKEENCKIAKIKEEEIIRQKIEQCRLKLLRNDFIYEKIAEAVACNNNYVLLWHHGENDVEAINQIEGLKGKCSSTFDWENEVWCQTVTVTWE